MKSFISRIGFPAVVAAIAAVHTVATGPVVRSDMSLSGAPLEMIAERPDTVIYPLNGYKKGWTVTAKRRNRRDTEQIVHNKTQYQLTHLLEFGHATRNGGRTKEFPHIGKVADKVPEIFERKLRDMIGEVSS